MVYRSLGKQNRKNTNLRLPDFRVCDTVLERQLPSDRDGPERGPLVHRMRRSEHRDAFVHRIRILEYNHLNGYAGGYGIALGPDRALWFAEANTGALGRITTSGVVSEIPLPSPLAVPRFIVLGPDGALWFTESGTNKIGRMQ